MRAYYITSHRQTGLERQEFQAPQPAPGEVLVRIHAASLNYRDLGVLAGSYPGIHPLPLVPLSDGAGEVESIGSGVTQWKKGDRVIGSFFQDWKDGPFHAGVPKSALGGARQGVLADFVVFKEDGVVRFPDYLSFEEAATLPCAGLTAWNALMERGGLQKGENVLLLGTGGVSIFGLQIAKAAGATVLITSKDDAKLKRAQALGADESINYVQYPEWDKRVLERTQGNGVNVVLEVGGAGTLARSLQAVQAGGRISLVGVLTGAAGEINPRPVTTKSLSLQGIFVGSQAMSKRFMAFLEILRIKPVIDRVFPFDDAIAAYDHLRSGSHFGKVVIRLT